VTGENGRVRYTLSTQSLAAHGHVYGLNADTGALYVKSLIDCDHAPRNKYVVLIVDARDCGLNPNLAHAKIYVHINDVNDNEPIIIVQEVNKYIGQVVYCVVEGAQSIV